MKKLCVVMLFLCAPLWAQEPYTVHDDTGALNCWDGSGKFVHCVKPWIEKFGKFAYDCNKIDSCEDLAAALNEGYYVRTHPSTWPSLSVPSEPKTEPYKEWEENYYEPHAPDCVGAACVEDK